MSVPVPKPKVFGGSGVECRGFGFSSLLSSDMIL